MSAKKTTEKKAVLPAADMTNEELLAALAKANAKNAELEKTNNEQADLVDDLSKAVASAGKGSKPKTVVKHDGVQYEVTCKSFSLDNKVITAEALVKNKDVVAKLVEMKSGHLKVVE